MTVPDSFAPLRYPNVMQKCKQKITSTFTRYSEKVHKLTVTRLITKDPVTVNMWTELKFHDEIGNYQKSEKIKSPIFVFFVKSNFWQFFSKNLFQKSSK